MLLDDGVTSLTVFPMAFSVITLDVSEVHRTSLGGVTDVTNGGAAPARRRRLTLRATTAERDALKSF